MEVDEYEGDGDRDMVEEDEDEDSELRLSGTDTPGEPLQSPSVLSADVLSPLPSEDCDTKNILLIDDQGIPYTLSQDGIKVPQVDASMPEVVQTDLPETEDKRTSLSPTLASPSLSQHLDTALNMSSSESNPGSEAISAEDVSSETDKPLTFAASPLQSQLATFDSLSQPTLEAQSPPSDSKFDSSDLPSEHLPLDDHLYFSNMAPPSPPIGPILSSGKLDSLDPLDPLSPGEASNSLGSRRVLCCQLCPRIFFYLSDLERHAITHSQKKPHVCQQCGKAFKRSSHLQHIHTGQRNFVCSICTKRFREAGELQRHQRVHTGEKPYQCQLCHTRFAERNTLRRHTKLFLLHEGYKEKLEVLHFLN
uniref:C2H2-type domain-containing protein n=1 Tax=Oryzias sinensis TaxID=183150 RepID=A0A8C7X0T2_9TELE